MLKKIALLVVMFALPLGAMAQAKFAHMNSQDVIAVMPEFTKAQADLDAMSKKYQDEMQRTNEEFQKKYQEFLAQADSLPKNIAERRQKELQDMAHSTKASPHYHFGDAPAQSLYRFSLCTPFQISAA